MQMNLLDRQKVLQLNISKVIPAIKCSPMQFEFGDVIMGQEKKMQLVIVNLLNLRIPIKFINVG